MAEPSLASVQQQAAASQVSFGAASFRELVLVCFQVCFSVMSDLSSPERVLWAIVAI